MRAQSAPGSVSHANGPEGCLPWLPWYPKDFLASTRGWPLVARGCYRELLDAQWDLGSLPAESRELRQLIGATAAEWRVSWDPFVAQKFPIGADGRRRNPRLEQHRLRAEGIWEVRRKASRLGVEARRRRDKLAPRAVQ